MTWLYLLNNHLSLSAISHHLKSKSFKKNKSTKIQLKNEIMKTIAFFFLAFLTCILSPHVQAQCADTCNIYSFTYSEKSYEIVKELKSWEEASQCAVERGGYLVHIDSLEEQTAVYNAIQASGISPTYISVSNGGGIAYIWIGATDKNTEGAWLWDGNDDGTGVNFWNGQGANGAGDGTVVSGKYANWGGTSKGTYQEPDDYSSNQDGAAIGLAGWPSGTTNLGIAGEWNDIISTSSIYYIVEYDTLKPSITECGTTGPGIFNIQEEAHIMIFPNPANNTFNLYTGNTPVQNLKLEVFNTDGKLIRNLNLQESNSSIIDLTGNPDGIYFLKLFINDEIFFRRVCLVE
jgi:hypothetical protein